MAPYSHVLHIDGMRGVAVLLVLLFHLGVPGFGGGFLGVDIFFVISGFVITFRVSEDISRDDFTLSSFYSRRLQRLAPSFLATLAVTSAFSIFLLPWPLRVEYAYSALASLAGMSNFYFWSKAGYFDTSAASKPLLHTWSLSVEEQFYAVWPCILLLLQKSKLPPPYGDWALYALSASAISMNLSWELGAPPFARGKSLFFFTNFRICEFLLGACLVPSKRKAETAETSRIVALLGCFGLGLCIYNTNSREANQLEVVLATTCTAMIIHSGEVPPLNFVLESQVLGFLGRASYSAYLVHWPLISLYKFWTLQLYVSHETQVVLFAATWGLGFALHKVVEVPFRSRRIPSPFRIIFLAFTALLAAEYYISQYSLPWDKSFLKSIEMSQRRGKYINQGCSVLNFQSGRFCRRQAKVQALVYGNSHEVDAYNAFHGLYGNHDDVNLVSFGGINRCAFKFQGSDIHISSVPGRGKDHCDKLRPMLTPKFAGSLTHVVHKCLYRREAWDRAERAPAFDDLPVLYWLKRHNPNIRIISFSSLFELRISCTDILWRHRTSSACLWGRYLKFGPFDQGIWSENRTIPLSHLLINTTKLACVGALPSCRTNVSGVPLTTDRDHFTLEYAEMIGREAWNQYGSQLISYGFPNATRNA